MPGTVTNKAAMTDRRSLSIIGYVLSGVAAVVIWVGIFVVQAHLTGDYIIDDSRPVVSNSLPTIGR